jgi:hypothetical protein
MDGYSLSDKDVESLRVAFTETKVKEPIEGKCAGQGRADPLLTGQVTGPEVAADKGKRWPFHSLFTRRGDSMLPIMPIVLTKSSTRTREVDGFRIVS